MGKSDERVASKMNLVLYHDHEFLSAILQVFGILISAIAGSSFTVCIPLLKALNSVAYLFT